MDLDYYEEPDYQMISGELMELYEKVLGGKEFMYDWALQPSEKSLVKEELTMKLAPHDAMKEQTQDVDYEKYNDD